jgi:orsellinic acid C2-O-methyltransferase
MTSALQDPEAAPELIKLINSVWMSQAVCVAAELGIADLLSGGPKRVQELARATDSHSPSLHRLMRALAALGLCRECDDGAFALTSAGALLCANGPESLRWWALWSRRFLWPLWGRLLDTVKRGQNARTLVYGTDGFGHLECDAEAAELFNHAMTALTCLVANEVARIYDFSGVRRIVDVGGGYGGLLAAILAAYPETQGVIYDLPHAMEGAQAYLAEADLATRCELLAGNFFESIPCDGDAYLLKSVIHDWNDERSGEILCSCRRAMGHGAKLLLVERVMPTRLEASESHRILARADLTMLIGLGGRERTEEELRALLDDAGLDITHVMPMALEFNIIEAVPRQMT